MSTQGGIAGNTKSAPRFRKGRFRAFGTFMWPAVRLELIYSLRKRQGLVGFLPLNSYFSLKHESESSFSDEQ